MLFTFSRCELQNQTSIFDPNPVPIYYHLDIWLNDLLISLFIVVTLTLISKVGMLKVQNFSIITLSAS